MKITMAHGSGGKTSAELMETVFAPYFSNEVLDRLEDAAVLDPGGPIAYSTDTFVVTPLVFPGGDIGKLAVCGTVNDLAMMGGHPRLSGGGLCAGGRIGDRRLDEDRQPRWRKPPKKTGVSIVAGDTKRRSSKAGASALDQHFRHRPSAAATQRRRFPMPPGRQSACAGFRLSATITPAFKRPDGH